MEFIKNDTLGVQRNILVIEDEDALRELLFEELSALGYRVATARNGVDGLEQMQDMEPDLIICDRAMPAMTGYELLERIRGVYPQYSDVPFVFLSALTDKRDRDAVKHLHPTAYLEKPLDFEELRMTIEKLLQS